MIAMAIANDPSVLIADEPTTALDVTIQAQIIEVLKAAQEETHAAIVLITHDLGLVAELADRVVVMYAGRVVELGDVYTIFDEPRHPYTVGLMDSLRAARRRAGVAAADPGPAAEHDHAAARLRVPPALHVLAGPAARAARTFRSCDRSATAPPTTRLPLRRGARGSARRRGGRRR